MDSTKAAQKIKNSSQNQSKSTKKVDSKKAPPVFDASWIQKNINMRQCIHFVPSEKDEKICHCGYDRKVHKKPKTSIATSNWDCSKNTVLLPTNAFGTIEFVDHVGYINPKFVRVDINTKMSTMLELMMKVGGMEKPKLLISVTGDGKAFTRLQSGLMKAAHSIGAWIITGGTHAGEPVRDQGMNPINQTNVVVIGIAPWGVIHNRKALEKKEGSLPAKYGITGKLLPNEIVLDPNHSHYILVDDGTQQKLETEIPFREKLEEEIAEKQANSRNDALKVLKVILVLGGGQGTLKTVENALKNNTPAIIVKGSGGAADILAYAFKHVETVLDDDKDNQGQDSQRYEKPIKEILENKIKNKMSEENVVYDVEVIMNCLAKSDLIHIFTLGSDEKDIDAVMLKALLRANKDLVKGQIATDKTKMPFILDDMMLYAIQYDKADFVKLLLDNGVILETFLTREKLLKLYNNVPSKSIFMELWLKKRKVSLKRIFKDFCKRKTEEEIRLKDVRHLVHDLVGGNYLQHYIHDQHANEGQHKDEDVSEVQKNDQDVNKVQNKRVTETQNTNRDRNEFQRQDEEIQRIQENDQDGNEAQKKKKESEDVMTKPVFENPCLDLLIWSVLNNQQDKAKLFWRYGKDKMAAALLAHALFTAMSREIDDRDSREVIDNNGSEFMTLAIKIAKACSKADEKDTQDLVTRKMQQWGNTTCIEIAVKAHNKGFISLKVCRDLFDKIWMGGLKQDNSIKALLVYMAIPLLIPLLARFEDDQHNSSSDETKSHGQKAICCLSSKRRKVDPACQTEANDRSEKLANNSSFKACGKSCEATICRCINAGIKFAAFYSAPIIIFMHNIISFVAFLLVYSYVLISKLEPHMSWAEISLIMWVCSSFVGEIMQVSNIQALKVWKRFKLYIADGWNVLDMLTILLFLIGMTILMSNFHPLAIEAARVIMGIDLMLFFLRILHTFHAHRQVGPKLVMIMNMVWDVGSLAAIIGVFILSYAIASYAILYPNTELTIDTVMKILKRPYWNIYGELGLEEIEGEDNCSNNEALYGNGTVPRCPTKAGQYVVPVMMGIYMLMTNILLLSLLIASFSYSIEKVQQHTDLHCSLHRYNLICEYCTKPWLPHPFALLIYLLKFIFYLCGKLQSKMRLGKCQSKCWECRSRIQCQESCPLSAFTQRRNTFKRSFDKKINEELSNFEDLYAVQVYQRLEQSRSESIGIKANKRDNRIDQLLSTVNQLKLAVKTKKPKSGPNQNILTAATNLEGKVANIEKQIKNMSEQLRSVIDSLKEQKIAAKQTQHEETDENNKLSIMSEQLQSVIDSLKEQKIAAKQTQHEETDETYKDSTSGLLPT